MRLREVNTTDLLAAIELGCQTMQRCFNADDAGRPHFDARALPEARLGFESPYTESHVPGRHLSALLAAESVLGVGVTEQAIAQHRAALFFSLSGPLPLPLCRARLDGPLLIFADHNVREALHGLHALVAYRYDGQAQALAERLIATIFELWQPRRGWDQKRLKAAGVKLEQRSFIWGLARAIGPLVKYQRCTGSTAALELALLLSELACAEFFTEDGGFDAARFGTHTHSTTCTLSGLAQLAELTGDQTLASRVWAFYSNGLRQIRDELGWVIEHADAPERNPDRGEANNTGDLIETALHLGRWGQASAYEDAERCLRGHLLPSQLRDTGFIPPSPVPAPSDGQRAVAERLRGAFGFAAPYGHCPVGMSEVQFCLDIVGGAVLSLVEAWRGASHHDATGHHVNLLFDHEKPELRLKSPYPGGVLELNLRRAGPLWLRMPSWVKRDELLAATAELRPRLLGDWLFVAQPPYRQPLSIPMPLAPREFVLRHRTREIRVLGRGDEVLAMDNFGADLTFFPSLEEAAQAGHEARAGQSES